VTEPLDPPDYIADEDPETPTTRRQQKEIEELRDLLSAATARISELKLALLSVEISGRRLLELEVFQNRIDDALNRPR